MFSFLTILCFASLSPVCSLVLNCLELSTSPIGPCMAAHNLHSPTLTPPPPPPPSSHSRITSSLLFNLTQSSRAFPYYNRNLHVMNIITATLGKILTAEHGLSPSNSSSSYLLAAPAGLAWAKVIFSRAFGK